jgi:putative effector of murein hydrolase
VVALAWPLWQRRAELRRRAGPPGGGAARRRGRRRQRRGIGWALGLPAELLRSLAPKSVTAPVAMGIAEQHRRHAGAGGGVCGADRADRRRQRQVPVRPRMGPLAPAVRGFALGTASHGIGAARALQEHPDAGAYAGPGARPAGGAGGAADAAG